MPGSMAATKSPGQGLKVPLLSVENSSATGRWPIAWAKETWFMCSGGSRVVNADRRPPTVAGVSVTIAGGCVRGRKKVAAP